LQCRGNRTRPSPRTRARKGAVKEPPARSASLTLSRRPLRTSGRRASGGDLGSGRTLPPDPSYRGHLRLPRHEACLVELRHISGVDSGALQGLEQADAVAGGHDDALELIVTLEIDDDPRAPRAHGGEIRAENRLP